MTDQQPDTTSEKRAPSAAKSAERQAAAAERSAAALERILQLLETELLPGQRALIAVLVPEDDEDVPEWPCGAEQPADTVPEGHPPYHCSKPSWHDQSADRAERLHVARDPEDLSHKLAVWG